ncbi:MAG: hypothetical protein PUK18_05785 [Firmicutes bacterium]|nr:hypothetical protein [Bacillota bacterium]MDY6160702.1 hypothetical protein [Candidatus Faecousia sp.]
MADWMRLDNAALIFPAVRRRDWTNAFRVSATLKEPVEPELLQQAVDALLPRFPSMYVSLHRGLFWYYLQKLKRAPRVRQDGACPLIHMTGKELRECCLRVLYYENRIAVECFHALTDGSGGMVFLKTLTAQYLSLRHGISIPAVEGVLDPLETPHPAELEDSFTRTAGQVPLSRKEENSLHLGGRREEDGFLHLTIASVPEARLLELAHEYGCTVTAFLCAVMLQSILKLARLPQGGRWAKVTVPVNLRKVLGGETLRNFALTVNVGVDPRLGSYTLRELTRAVQSQLETQVTAQQMAARVAANVQPSQNFLIKILPLPIKNFALRMVYRRVGECKGSINVSNLGKTKLPGEMAAYVRFLDFTIGPQATYANNCSVVSYGGVTRINLIRSTVEPRLERDFLTRLVELGLEVTVDSNERS